MEFDRNLNITKVTSLILEHCTITNMSHFFVHSLTINDCIMYKTCVPAPSCIKKLTAYGREAYKVLKFCLLINSWTVIKCPHLINSYMCYTREHLSIKDCPKFYDMPNSTNKTLTIACHGRKTLHLKK